MKKSRKFYLYWGLCALCVIGIGKASGVSSQLYAFAHNLDMHGDDDAIEKRAQAQMKKESDERKRLKEEKERKAEEKKRADEKKKREEEKERQRKEEKKAKAEADAQRARDSEKKMKAQQEECSKPFKS